MNIHCCNPKICDKKDTCNHHIVKPIFKGNKILEDMSDICLPEYRLYIEGDFYRSFPSKRYYESLLKFYDNECPMVNCNNKETYDRSVKCRSSRISCKLGESFTCKNPRHPQNKIIIDSLKTIDAENKAFEKAGLTEGTVTYICPICGETAIANRYVHDGRVHGLGSGCKKCGTSHT